MLKTPTKSPIKKFGLKYWQMNNFTKVIVKRDLIEKKKKEKTIFQSH